MYVKLSCSMRAGNKVLEGRIVRNIADKDLHVCENMR